MCCLDGYYLLFAIRVKDARQQPLHLGLPVLLLFDTKIMLELNQYLFLFRVQNMYQYYIGEYFEEGTGRDIDLIQALFWYRKAAQGDQYAMNAVERLLHE